MSVVSMLYLADFVEHLAEVLAILLTCSGLYFIISVTNTSVENKPKTKSAKITLSVSLLSLTILALLPTRKTVYMMAAASYTQEIASNPKVTELGDKVYKLLNQKLDEALEHKK